MLNKKKKKKFSEKAVSKYNYKKPNIKLFRIIINVEYLIYVIWKPVNQKKIYNRFI